MAEPNVMKQGHVLHTQWESPAESHGKGWMGRRAILAIYLYHYHCSSWATVTEHHRVGWLKPQTLTSSVLKLGSIRSQPQQIWCLVRAYSWFVGPRMAETGRDREREEASFLASYEGTNPITAPLSGANYLWMTSFPDIIMLGTRALT